MKGDEKESLSADEESLAEWTKYVPENRILKGNKKDNFWEMGDTGPCGPSTEIHVDCRTDDERAMVNGRDLVNRDHPQVIEIWNNVFMQFNRLRDGSLEPLPERHVDTGMGFERLVRVIQEKQSNYDTDVFTGTISETEKISGKKYDFGDSKQAVAFRVIADHIRAIAFTISDGQLPANTGAGYVVRRILRRAVRYYYSSLDFREPLLYRLLPVIASQFQNVFPELELQKGFVTRVVKEEEEAFLRTLEKGLKKIEDVVSSAASSGNNKLDGHTAFELFDTFGFPLDLTRLIAAENNMDVDEKGFEQQMLRQKNRSRAATTVDTDDWKVLNDSATTRFVGYDDLSVQTEVVKYRKVTSKNTEQYQVVLATTPFYAESGGQVGDKGTLRFGEEIIRVSDTKKENNLIIHFITDLPSDISMPVTATVDMELRLDATYNHTATHLLHAALRKVLGTHVSQKGSLVSPEILRFDFSHFAKLNEKELREVESLVNEKIRENIPVIVREMSKEEAMKTGAMALFGEKYGDRVRVVMAGQDFSVELCGGTHVAHTGMIGVFTILSETAVAAGVRRIEAVTGSVAMLYLNEKLWAVQTNNRSPQNKGTLQGNREDESRIKIFWKERSKDLTPDILCRSEMNCYRKMK